MRRLLAAVVLTAALAACAYAPRPGAERDIAYNPLASAGQP